MRFIAQTLDQMRDGTPLSASNPPPAAELFVPGCGAAGAGYPCPLKGFLATVADAVAGCALILGREVPEIDAVRAALGSAPTMAPPTE
jgi:hypothetical protein